ncbi:hypothetical protein H4696_009182 [Amycolatopsis lexingtonensis]|uniref:Uncharacterized protein n=1 Tax=Amycolatopsis lexingtonensis TaxID=218822 RepID=A0ABR9IFW4_9PSEU|nr:hypothetical protein [Amycolatopsis lexingtonensis]
MNGSFTSPDVRRPAKSGRCGPQRCADVLNDSFRTSEDLNESFKTWSERVTGGGVTWPRDFAGAPSSDAVNGSFTTSGPRDLGEKGSQPARATRTGGLE